MRFIASLQLGLVAACALASLPSFADAQSTDTTSYGPWTSKGIPPSPPRKQFQVPDDEDIEFVVNDGMGKFAFVSCVSEAPGQPTIRGDSLPVGGGRTLVCTTREPPVSLVRLFMTQDSKRWCLKGEAVEYRTVSDARLKVTVSQTSAKGTWTLRATSATQWTVKPVQSSLGSVLPLWLELKYDISDLRPARNGSCDGVF